MSLVTIACPPRKLSAPELKMRRVFAAIRPVIPNPPLAIDTNLASVVRSTMPIPSIV
jgi:hypothetical protein